MSCFIAMSRATAISSLHGRTLAAEHGHGKMPHGGCLMPVAPERSTESPLVLGVWQLTTPMTAKIIPQKARRIAARTLCRMFRMVDKRKRFFKEFYTCRSLKRIVLTAA